MPPFGMPSWGSTPALQSRDLPRKKRIARKLDLQRRKQLKGPLLMFISHARDRQQNSGKWRQVMSALSSQLQVRDAALLIRRQPAHLHQPAHRSRHAANDVLAEARSQLRVVTIRTNRQQLLRPGRSLLGMMQRGQIAFFNQRGIVGLQSGREGQSKQR